MFNGIIHALIDFAFNKTFSETSILLTVLALAFANAWLVGLSWEELLYSSAFFRHSNWISLRISWVTFTWVVIATIMMIIYGQSGHLHYAIPRIFFWLGHYMILISYIGIIIGILNWFLAIYEEYMCSYKFVYGIKYVFRRNDRYDLGTSFPQIWWRSTEDILEMYYVNPTSYLPLVLFVRVVWFIGMLGSVFATFVAQTSCYLHLLFFSSFKKE